MRRPRLIAATIVALVAVTGGVGASTAAKPAPRDTLVIAVQELGTTLDPKIYQANSMVVLQSALEPLLFYKYKTIKGSDTPVFDAASFDGGVVASWALAPNGKYLQMTLRSGVKSPYGNTLTTADVEWTVKRNIALRTLGGAFAFGQAGVDPENPITVVNERTFRWNLKTASPNLLKVLVFHWEGPFDSTEAKKHATSTDPWASDWLSTHTAGFGPYNVESYTPGQSATLVANPNYWATKLPIRRVVIRVVPDPGNRQQLLERGAVQLVPDLPRVQYAQLAKSKRVKLERARSTRMLYLLMNNKIEPWSNRLVRQAVAWAVPYLQINQQAYKGTGTLASGPVSPLLPYHIGKTWRYKTNSTRAKQLLTQAGFPNGFNATLQYSLSNPGPENAQVAVLIQSALKNIGINVTLEQVTSDSAYFSDLIAKKIPFGLGGTAPFVPDAGYQLFNTGTCAAPSAFAAYCNTDFEELVVAANTTTDPSRRGAALSTAQVLWARDVPMVPILEPNYGVAMDAKLTGYTSTQTGYPYLRTFKFTS